MSQLMNTEGLKDWLFPEGGGGVTVAASWSYVYLILIPLSRVHL